jgi:hypothetical protein
VIFLPDALLLCTDVGPIYNDVSSVSLKRRCILAPYAKYTHGADFYFSCRPLKVISLPLILSNLHRDRPSFFFLGGGRKFSKVSALVYTLKMICVPLMLSLALRTAFCVGGWVWVWVWVGVCVGGCGCVWVCVGGWVGGWVWLWVWVCGCVWLVTWT